MKIFSFHLIVFRVVLQKSIWLHKSHFRLVSTIVDPQIWFRNTYKQIRYFQFHFSLENHCSALRRFYVERLMSCLCKSMHYLTSLECDVIKSRPVIFITEQAYSTYGPLTVKCYWIPICLLHKQISLARTRFVLNTTVRDRRARTIGTQFYVLTLFPEG